MNESSSLLERARQGDQTAFEKAVEDNTGLVWAIVKRYYGCGVDSEDLYQLGCIGLMKAIRGFDTRFGTKFSTYAVPKIAGEIRRFLRDDGTIKVGRTLRERGQSLWSAREKLCHLLGREPTLSELSESTGIPPEEIAEIELANIAPESLQRENADGLTLESTLAEDGPEWGILEKMSLRSAIEKLPEKERMTIFLRYYKNMTQQQTAKILNVSQVQISRLERRAICSLKQDLQE